MSTQVTAAYTLDDTGFTCSICGSASGFSGRALQQHLSSHGVGTYTADLCHLASLHLASKLKRVEAGLLCLLCNKFLPKPTFESFQNHCKKSHCATLSGDEVERAFDAVLASTIQRYRPQLPQKLRDIYHASWPTAIMLPGWRVQRRLPRMID